ncbi:hypothetical protein GQ44DRAFT_744375 [Phaeosphaeriaceae sp. PMI808]|nr:hypothetical protein GQ44DRAFT_744375 [Phaeosphaeriaceae sp. PMI808]
MAPRLWIMTTFSSGNINPLHRQRVKGREIIITEEPRLHLVWIHNRIFIKPLPRYLLSQAFWEKYLEKGSGRPGENNLRLIPKNVDWASFCRFVTELNRIEDSAVSKRYGELRPTRLNFYAPFLLRKSHLEQVHGQHGDFLGRLYGPLLFVFAVVSTILNSMQVALAAEQLVAAHWESVWYVSRCFSIMSLVGAAIVSTWFILLWLWMFLDEWICTVRCKLKKRQGARSSSSC